MVTAEYDWFWNIKTNRYYFHDRAGKVIGEVYETVTSPGLYRALYENKVLGMYINKEFAKQAIINQYEN